MKRNVIIAVSAIVFLLMLFVTTDPGSVPSFVLVMPFILLFIFLLSLSMSILQKRGIALPQSVRFGALCSSVPIVLLILQSIGQLTFKDVLAIVVLFVLSYFYMSRLAPAS